MQILVAGGCNKWCEVLNVPDEQPLSSAEIFDLKTGNWIKAADMPTPLSSAKMELFGSLPTTIGGFNGTGVTSNMYQYDVETNEWSINKRLKLRQARNNAAVLQVPRQYFTNC